MNKEIEKTLFSVNELATRWGFGENTVRSLVNEGKLPRVKNLSSTRIHINVIRKFEGLDEIDPMSPLERRRLENRINKLEKENNDLTRTLAEMHSISSKVFLIKSAPKAQVGR